MVFLKPDNLCRLILLQILLSLGTLISMAHILCFLFSVLTSTIRSRLSLQLEIAALRYQLSAYRLQGRRPRIAPPDRLIWSVLAKLWSQYLDYYHPWRTHRALGQDAPDGRRVRLAKLDQIAEFPVVQGLHHYYLPKAA